MRLLPVFLAVVSVCAGARHGASSTHRRVVRAVALPDGHTVYAVSNARSLRPVKVDKVDREQRVLKKKKRRLKALREEIRALSGQLRPPHPEKANKTKDARWRKKVLEKMKVIVRRLERMERTMEGKMSGGAVIVRERKSGKRAQPRPQPVVLTTLAPVSATVARPAIAHATMTPDKVKSLHSSVLRSMSGENGTACVTHGDCRPGRCCHRFTQSGAALQQCRFHGLDEGEPCRDSCQCANRLHCFQSTGNTTDSFCKSALVEDIRRGSYLYDKESHFTDAALIKTKKKKRAAKTATKSVKPTKRQ